MYPNPNQPPIYSRPPLWWQIRKDYYQRRFNALPLPKKITLGCGTLLGAFLLCALCSGIGSLAHPADQSTDAQSSPAATASHPVISATATAQTATTRALVTPTPKPTPTSAPIVQPTPASELTVTFTLVEVTNYSDSYISVHTLPGATLSINVIYCSGKEAKSAPLQGTVQADASGDYIWSWQPDTDCQGMATATVTASLNGETATNSTTFTVS